MTGLLILLALSVQAKEDASIIKQDITIKGKSAAGLPIAVPEPSADPAVVNEVINSLDVIAKPHEAAPIEIKLDATSRRLRRPFPEPPFLSFAPKNGGKAYDRWTFEVLEGETVLWKTEGEGAMIERVEWDGTGTSGAMAARAGGRYHFVFSGRRGSESYSIASRPIELKSLGFKETLGGFNLEVDNRLIFKPGKSAFSDESKIYLDEIADRMRRVNLKDQIYRFALYQEKPESPLAKARAAALVKFFSRYLLISPSRITLDVRSVRDRGDSFSCQLPAEMGETFRTEE